MGASRSLSTLEAERRSPWMDEVGADGAVLCGNATTTDQAGHHLRTPMRTTTEVG